MTRQQIISMTVLFLAAPCYGYHGTIEVPVGHRQAHKEISRASAPPLLVEIYAPDWVWQKSGPDSNTGTDINALLTVNNRSDEEIDLICHVSYPDSFTSPDPLLGLVPARGLIECSTVELYARVAPGVTRHALPPIVALMGHPSGSHELEVSFPLSRSMWFGDGTRQPIPWYAGSDESVTIPIRTIRGAAVSNSLWAKLLPAIIGLVWCGVVTFFMRSTMKRNIWRQTFAPDTEEFHPCENP